MDDAELLDPEEDERDLAWRFEDLCEERGFDAAVAACHMSVLPCRLDGVEVLQGPDGNDLWVYHREVLRSAEEWLAQLDEDDLDAFAPQDVHQEFWEKPRYLYHATRPERAASILANGLEQRNETRGLTNREVGDAVFAHLSARFVRDGYGDVVIEIDCPMMKADGLMPEVEMEPPLRRREQRERVAWAIGLEDYAATDGDCDGLDIETRILYADIPTQYLRVCDDDADEL